MLKTKKTTTPAKTEDPLDVLIARLLEWCKAGCPTEEVEEASSTPDEGTEGEAVRRK